MFFCEYCKIFKKNIFIDHLSGVQQQGEGGRPPLPFFKSHKKCPDFGKNGSDSVHLSVKISIQNVVLWVSRKPPKFYPAMPFFLKFLTRCLSKCPNSPKIALVARKLCLPSVARFKLLYWIPKRNSLLLFFIIFIVLLPFSMNFEFKFDLNFNSISFFHVNSKISLGFFLIK